MLGDKDITCFMIEGIISEHYTRFDGARLLLLLLLSNVRLIHYKIWAETITKEEGWK